MHGIWTEDQDAQQDGAHQMIQLAKPWKIRRWSESELTNGKPLLRIPQENTHLVDLEWNENEQAKLMTPVERYTSQGTSGAWRVYRWQLACCSLLLGDTEDRNDILRQWYKAWPLDPWVDSLMFRWLRDTFLPMLFNESTENPEPDQDDASIEALQHESGSFKSTMHRSLPPQKAVVLCPPPGQVRYLKWWLRKFFLENLDIFYMFGEMGNDERTEMQLKLQDLPNPSVFVTAPKVGGTGLNLTAANHAALNPKFWPLNEQREAFAWVVRLGQNRVPHTWLLNSGPNGYDNRASDLHQLSSVDQMRFLHGLMNRPDITMRMIYWIMECRQDHMKRLMGHGDTVPSDGEDER